MKSFTGKVRLTLEREDSEWVPYHLTEFEELEGGYENVHEDFGLLETETWQVPDAAKTLNVGESVTVEVAYEVVFTADYYGEVDADLYYTDQKVINPHPLT